MLDVKKILAKITEWIDQNKIQTVTVTATTNAQGAVSVGSVPATATIIRASVSNYTNAMCIPWLYNNAVWYVKVVNWSNFAVVGNTSLNLVIKYRMGGGST